MRTINASILHSAFCILHSLTKSYSGRRKLQAPSLFVILSREDGEESHRRNNARSYREEILRPSTRSQDDATGCVPAASLDGNLGAGLFEDLLDLVGLFLRDVLLDHLRSAFDEILRFFQAECGHFADSLDDVDLLVAGAIQRHGEFSLHLGRSRGGSRRTGSRNRGGGSSGGN